MNIYNIVKELDIPNGHTKRMSCPNCGTFYLIYTPKEKEKK